MNFLLLPLDLDLSLVLFAIIFVLFVIYFFRTRYLKAKSNSREEEIIKSLDERNKAFIATGALNNIILQTLDFNLLAQRIADAIPQFLGYKTGVLAIIDESKGVLRRVAISQTTGGEAALKSLEVPFSRIEIKLTEKNNYCIKSLLENKAMSTTKLYDVLGPAISEANSDLVQKQMGTKVTLIYPIYSMSNKPLGTFLVSMNKEESQISEFEHQTIRNFVDGVKIALTNASLYTSLRKTTEQLKQANYKLHELDHLKDDFVSIASHELRTPMTAIRSYAWMALHRSDVPLSKTLEKYIARILISTERLINMVNDMLNVSRIESNRIEINPEPVDLLSLAKDIVDEVYYSKSQEKKIQFVVLEKPVPKVFADPDKLRQVFLNLVGNSLKFTPDGGKIIFDFFSDGKVVETSVSDTGVGISKEDMSKLFYKFSRLDNSYTAAATSGGTGLGLYISKSLIDLMHGKIWVHSEGASKGTTFTVSLPVATPEILQNAQKYKIKPSGEVKGLEPVAI